MIDVDIRHKKAMRLADHADLCQVKKNFTTARIFYTNAADLEYQCALESKGMFPSELVFARSAAWLYHNASKFDRAKEVVNQYLEKSKGTEFYAELQEILEKLV